MSSRHALRAQVLHERSILAYVAMMPLVTFQAIKLPTSAVLFVTVLGILALATAPRGMLGRMRISTAAVAFIGWCLMSALWIFDSTLYINRSERFLIPSLVFLAIGASTSARVIMRGFLLGFYTMVGYTVLTIATSASAREQQATSYEGALAGWHGPFDHKNALSTLLVVGVVVMLAFEPRRAVRLVVFAVVGILLIGSRSGTGLAGMIFVFTAWNWLRTFIKQRNRMSAPFVLVSFVGLAASLVVGLSTLPILLAAYGKDTTFTGRTNIWSGVLWAIRQRPLLGYGYSGVWVSDNREPTFSMMRRIGFRAFHAHNGTLDVVLQVGLIGLILFLCLLLPLLSCGFRLARKGNAVGAVALVAGLAIVIMALSESLFLGPWIPFLCLFRGMSLRAEQPRFRRSRLLQFDDETGQPETIVRQQVATDAHS